jgi:integrase
VAHHTRNLHRHRNGTYYAIFYQQGKQKWETLDTKSLREAKARLRRLRAAREKNLVAGTATPGELCIADLKELIVDLLSKVAEKAGEAGNPDGGQLLVPSTPKIHRIDFAEAVRKHFSTLTFRSPKTEQMYASQKSRLLKLCPEWESFSPAAHWNRTQSGEGHRQPPGNSSLNHFRIYLCTLTNWMVTQGWITEQLAKEARAIARKKVHNRKPVIPRPEQMETLLRQIEMKDRETGQFFRFLTYTGARIGSALKVKWSNVHWDRQQIDFCLKGDEEKTIFLHQKALDLLIERRKEQEPSPRERIFPFDANWIRRARILLRTWAEALELQITTPHMFRHYGWLTADYLAVRTLSFSTMK